MLEITLICDKCDKRDTAEIQSTHMGMPTYDANVRQTMEFLEYTFERISKEAPYLVCKDCKKDFKKIKEKHSKEAKGFFKKV